MSTTKRPGPARSGIILQAYPDHVRPAPGQTPLQALAVFLDRLPTGAVDTLHLLPPYQSSGDFGFAVSSYRNLEPRLGSWEDIAALRRHVALVLDFVVNHVSSEHPWFTGYLSDDPALASYFIEIDPSWDLSALARPRAGLPISDFDAADGRTRQVWTSYGRMQVDLNYRSDALRRAVTAELAHLVTRTGAGIRLDSLAFLWKEPGRRSIHADGTFAVAAELVAAIRSANPQAFVIAEVDDDLPPHKDYRVRSGADATYRYALPPLIAHALLAGTSRHLNQWLAALPDERRHTGINLTATHDGIFLRPYDPPLPPDGIALLADHARDRGATVQYRDGAAYELNTTFATLLSGTGSAATDTDRHVAAQAIAITLPGIAQVYLPSLLALPHEPGSAVHHDDPRAVNRTKDLDLPALLQHAAAADSYQRLCALLRIRSQRPAAFAADAAFKLLDMGEGVLGFVRGTGPDAVHVLVNLTASPARVTLGEIGLADLLAPTDDDVTGLMPYQLRLLTGPITREYRP